MPRGTIRLGRIFGIEIGLHFSWVIIAALLTISLAGHLYTVNREWSNALIWTAASIAAVAFLPPSFYTNCHTQLSRVPTA